MKQQVATQEKSKVELHREKCRENLVKARANKKPMTEETKQRISNKLLGHVVSETTKKKISKAKKGVSLPPHSLEAKMAISASVKKYWNS